MMPSRTRLASATAAGVVGLAVAGLILFGAEPLGTGAAVTAVPAPAAASGAAATETEAEPVDEAAATPNRRPWRAKPVSTVSSTPRGKYKPAPRTARSYRTPGRYGQRPAWRATRRPTARPTRSPLAPTMTPILPSAAPTRSTAKPTSTPTASRSTTSPSPTPTSAAPKPTSASPASSSKYASRSDWAAAVLDRLNSQRASHGLPALRSNAKLAAAAHAHNLRCAAADDLSHQLPGEAGLAGRMSAAG